MPIQTSCALRSVSRVRAPGPSRRSPPRSLIAATRFRSSRSELLALAGIGPWTADYLDVMAGDRDAFRPGIWCCAERSAGWTRGRRRPGPNDGDPSAHMRCFTSGSRVPTSGQGEISSPSGVSVVECQVPSEEYCIGSAKKAVVSDDLEAMLAPMDSLNTWMLATGAWEGPRRPRRPGVGPPPAHLRKPPRRLRRRYWSPSPRSLERWPRAGRCHRRRPLERDPERATRRRITTEFCIIAQLPDRADAIRSRSSRTSPAARANRWSLVHNSVQPN